MDTDTRRTSRTDRAPAADAALDAVERIEDRARRSPSTYAQRAGYRDDADLIRDALADRITPAEANTILGWESVVEANSAAAWTDTERALIARLGRMADPETGR